LQSLSIRSPAITSGVRQQVDVDDPRFVSAGDQASRIYPISGHLAATERAQRHGNREAHAE